MSLRRILKMLAAFLTGQGVTVVTQLLVPPFFLHRYADGVAVYGEWVALRRGRALPEHHQLWRADLRQ